MPNFFSNTYIIPNALIFILNILIICLILEIKYKLIEILNYNNFYLLIFMNKKLNTKKVSTIY